MNRGTWLSLLLSALFIYLFLCEPHPGALLDGELGWREALFTSRMDWPEVGRVLGEVRFLPLGGALLALVTSMILRAWRWRAVVAPVKKLPVPLFFHLTNLGYMANNLLPMRMGEVLRAVALSARSKVGFTASLASIVLERLLDLVGAISVLLLLLWMGPPLAVGADGGELIARFQDLLPGLGLAVAALFSLLVGLVLFRERLLKLLEGLLDRFLPKRLAQRLHRMADTFAQGLAILESPGEAVLLLAQTLFIYGCYLVSLAFMLQAFGITGEHLPALAGQPFAALCMLLVFVTFGYMIPAAPGALGTVQYFTLLALQLMGDGGARAQSFAVGNHLLTWLVLTGFGLLALPALKLDFGKLLEWKKERA